MRVTILIDGSTDPPGSADYVTDSVGGDGLRVRHYVCRGCLELFDAPDGADTIHVCVGEDAGFTP